MSRTNEERLATVEANDIHVRLKVDKIDKRQEELYSDVQEIKQSLSRQKGFIAGVMFIITPIWAAVIMFAKDIWDKVVS